MPRPTSGWPKTALSEQMRISQLMASSLPPPSAKPLTAAMTGMGNCSIIRKMSLPSLPKASPSALVIVLIEPMSAPATKLLSPSPVSTMQRMVSWVHGLKGGLQVGSQDFGVQRVQRLGAVDGDDLHRAPALQFSQKPFLSFPFRLSGRGGAGACVPRPDRIFFADRLSPSRRWWRSPCRRRCTGWPGPSWRRDASWRTAG